MGYYVFKMAICPYNMPSELPVSTGVPAPGPVPFCTEDGTLNEHDETARGLEVPRERDATLLAAILRIGASLDLDTVLRAVSTVPAR